MTQYKNEMETFEENVRSERCCQTDRKQKLLTFSGTVMDSGSVWLVKAPLSMIKKSKANYCGQSWTHLCRASDKSRSHMVLSDCVWADSLHAAALKAAPTSWAAHHTCTLPLALPSMTFFNSQRLPDRRVKVTSASVCVTAFIISTVISPTESESFVNGCTHKY